MIHIQDIRLRPHKGLKQGILNDLGKVNVLCGPNNSGKTTVLECIADSNLHFLGIGLDSNISDRFEKAALGNAEWSSERSAEFFRRFMSETVADHTVWFADEGKYFLQKFLVRWQKIFGTTEPGDRNRILKAFQAEFPNPKMALIPAKRKLETVKVVFAAEPIAPDGTGLLNFLFYAKNLQEDSDHRKQLTAIIDAFRKISGGYEFDVQFGTKPQNRSPRENLAELKFRYQHSQWIDGADCGLGLLDLIILLYFALSPDYDVVLIEEPENHLHPEIQRRLVQFLREQPTKQFFLSTHSSVFLNTQFADKVFICKMTDGVEISNSTSRASMLAELGYSIADNLVSDLVVLCEGPKDKPFLEEFFQKYDIGSDFIIKIWPLGGDIMDQLDLSVFQQSYRLIALVDSDPGSREVRKRFKNMCSQLDIPVVVLKRYAIENYFSLGAIESVMKKELPENLLSLDPKKKVSKQLGFEVKRNSGEIARAMRKEDIAGTDLEKFFETVKSLLTE